MCVRDDTSCIFSVKMTIKLRISSGVELTLFVPTNKTIYEKKIKLVAKCNL